MIINTEVKDFTKNGVPVLDSYGRCKRLLIVSYVGSDSKIHKFVWVIPEESMYQWKYARKNDNPDPVFKSWNFKPVIKEEIVGNFSEQRIHEMLLDLKKYNPDNEDIKMFDELYVPETTFGDIEVEVGDNGFPKAKDALNPLTTTSFVRGTDVYVLGRANLTDADIKWIQNEIDKHCEKFNERYTFHYRYHDNEISLINDIFKNFIGTSECVSGWNWFGYDWPYLCNRCERLGIDIQWLSPTNSWTNYKPMDATSQEDTVKIPMHRAMYDYLEIYKKWDESIKPKISNKLDWVAETVLGVKKVVHQLGFREMWKQQPAQYVFYNAIDSILIREIDKKLRVSSIFFGLANLMHTPALTAFSSTKSIEIVQAEYLYKENRIFPKAKKENEKGEYEGAFVFEPTPGIYKDTLTADYASLYPTTCRQFNISPDTFLFKDKSFVPTENEIKCVNGSVYTKQFKGFIPKILDDFFAKRKSFKKEMLKCQDIKYELSEILERRKAAANG